MDLSGIISVSGMNGLYKVVAQTRNGVLVESLSDGKRLPVYSTSKVSALEDISIYGTKDDIPLKDIFKLIRDTNAGKEIPDTKGDAAALKTAFGKFVPEYDKERVYTSDMKKVFTWYNQLLAKDLLKDKAGDEEKKQEEKLKAEGGAPKPAKAAAKKETPKAAPKASSKGMAKTATVRKTGG